LEKVIVGGTPLSVFGNPGTLSVISKITSLLKSVPIKVSNF
jgi:hypothetical protein